MQDFSGSLPIQGEIVLTHEPEESIVMCTPFHKKAHFYYNQKINCMRASGTVVVRGRHYEFEPDTAFAVLDWGRGVWTYKNTWYWGSASGEAEGVPFGFNIGYGFGDTSAATENALFYDGRLHKLSRVSFNIPRRAGKFDYMSPWSFTSDDNRFEMDFRPVLDRRRTWTSSCSRATSTRCSACSPARRCWITARKYASATSPALPSAWTTSGNRRTARSRHKLSPQVKANLKA